MAKRIALVTGANTGIGYATVKALSKTHGCDVILTALTNEDAQKAVEQLKSEGCDVTGHQLDITDQSSIDTLKAYVEKIYGGLDILVNNAGVSYKSVAKEMGKEGETKVVYECAKRVLDVNLFGTISMSRTMNSLLRKDARIVILSSRGGGFALRFAPEAQKQALMSPDLTTPQVVELVNKYLEDVKTGDYESKGWSADVTYSYPLSKIAHIKMVAHLQKELDKNERNIIANACCPGVVATPLSDFKGCPADQGAQTPVYLATLPADGPKGCLVAEQGVITLEDLMNAKGMRSAAGM